jgi:hypothetical protein
MTMQPSSDHPGSDDDEMLVVWLRHYGALIALFVVLGIAAGLILAAQGSPAEATTLIVDRTEAIPAREFGVVGQTVFRSDAAVRPAMGQLGISTSAERFLAESVELRPVPDARVLIVVGRASTAARAQEVSETMAQALVAALDDAGVEGLAVLTGGIESRSLAPSVLVALGGFAGLWLGIGTAIALYHVRRPVLSLPRALRLLSPTRVTLLDGRASWLGSLRGLHVPGRGRDEMTATRRAARNGHASVDGSPRTSSSRTVEVTPAAQAFDEEGTTILVVDAGTRETELALEALGRSGERVDLHWIR